MLLGTTRVSLPNGISFHQTGLAGCTSVTDICIYAHASLPGPTAPLVTEILQLPVPGYGTVYRHISEMLTYRAVGCGSH